MAARPEPVLIDTSAWIDAFQEKTPWVTQIIRTLLEEDRAVTCGPVLFEIRRGLQPSERKKVLPLFDALHLLPFEEIDWSEAGELDAALRKKGRTLPSMDVLIAHICMKHKTSILTLDGHFQFVPGLNIQANPALSP
jgi:predicted nucleic acid-binding protein